MLLKGEGIHCLDGLSVGRTWYLRLAHQLVNSPPGPLVIAEIKILHASHLNCFLQEVRNHFPPASISFSAVVIHKDKLATF